MKIYTDSPDLNIYAGAPADVYVEADNSRPGKLRRFRYDRVRLRALPDTGHNRHPNSGRYGADSYEYAATWDEHGKWMARLFGADPNLLIVGACRYDGAADFHEQTANRYA